MRRWWLVIGMLVAMGCAPVPECDSGFAECPEGCTVALCSRDGTTFQDCADRGGCEPGELDRARCEMSGDQWEVVCPEDTVPSCFCD